MNLPCSVVKSEVQIDKIVSIIKGQKDIGSFPTILQTLRDAWLKCTILKRQRWRRKRINFEDAYILGVLAPDKSWIAIKIHPDKYDNCKRIYDDPISLSWLIAAGDVPQIYNTFTHKNSRVVLYEWSRDPTVEYVIKKYPDKADELRLAIQRRTESLVSKWWVPDALGYSDMIAHPDKGVTITDINKICHQSSVKSMDIIDGKEDGHVPVWQRILRKFW